MSLTARERHALHGIEERLTRSDTGLASLLGTFTRLTSGEEMPACEQIHAGRWRSDRHRPANRQAALHLMACRPVRLVGWQRIILLLWLAIALALTATALTLSRAGGKLPCSQPWPVSCAGHSSAGSGQTGISCGPGGGLAGACRPAIR